MTITDGSCVRVIGQFMARDVWSCYGVTSEGDWISGEYCPMVTFIGGEREAVGESELEPVKFEDYELKQRMYQRQKAREAGELQQAGSVSRMIDPRN